MNRSLNNFTGGEWSPFLDARAELQKYDSACLRLENFKPLPWGGAALRSGLLRLAGAKYNDRPFRPIPFIYSTSIQYILEVGDYYIRIHNQDGTPQQISFSPAGWSNVVIYQPGQYTTWTDGKVYICLQTANATNPPPNAAYWLQTTNMEVATPWPASVVFQLQYKQLNDQIRFVIGTTYARTLTYNGPGNWTIDLTAFKYPVLLDQNADQSILVSCSVTSGNGTLTATSAIFNVGMVFSQWELQHLRESDSQIIDMDNQTIGVTVYSDPILMQGDWTFSTSQFWWGRIQVERSVDGGTTWIVIRDFQGKSDQNYSTSGTEEPPNIGDPEVQYRLAYTQAGTPFDPAVWVGSPPTDYAFAQATLESEDAYIAGVVTISGFTDSTHVSVTVNLPLQSTDPTYLWSEAAFSTYRGFPTTIGFYEQRLMYGGTAYQPNTVWGSVSADFDNFQYSANDDGAIAFQPAVTQQNPIQWLESLLRVHIGTSGEEIIMASGNLDEALTPSNVTMRKQSAYGSSGFQPVTLQNSIIFVERNGLRIREMRELSPYIVPTDFVAPDLTIMAEHILGTGIQQMDFGRIPDPLIFCVRTDGQLAVMTYNREQNIQAWARYVTSGTFEGVAVLYGSPADTVYVSVARVINGQTVRSLEAFTTDPSKYPDQVTNCLVDAAAQVQVGVANPYTGQTIASGATVVTGLAWLAGAPVRVVLDGECIDTLSVDGSGNLTLPKGIVSTVNVGLAYTAYLTPMKTAINEQGQSSQGLKVRVSKVVVRVRDSLTMDWAGKPNPTAADWRAYQFQTPNYPVARMSLAGQAGKVDPRGISDWPLPGPWGDGYSFSGNINFRASQPFPLTILAAFIQWAAEQPAA